MNPAHPYPLNRKLGILGGGQLGKMVALAAGNWHLPLWILDESVSFPSAPYVTHFIEGDFRNYEDVLHFGRPLDVITIEIEHVNTAALRQLVLEGKTVHPAPDKLDIIKDKGLQKAFYLQHQLPTSAFRLFENEAAVRAAIANGELDYPFVQKTRSAGYDGRGVAVIQSPEKLSRLLPGPCLVEEMVAIQKELSVIVARNENGQTTCFPAVEMDFNAEANLVEWLISPARISPALHQAAEALAIATIEAYDLCGLLAVEMFLTTDNQLLINEVAPRPHNSGHQTIENCYTSQFEQHLRAVLNLPLGGTQLLCPAVMINLLGEPGYEGPAYYQGWAEALAIPGVNIHLYGKSTTKPFRKMGHVTILGQTIEEAQSKAQQVKDILRVQTQ
jgi:5-(carboxyamino)imidazole ribonucleotide synthase